MSYLGSTFGYEMPVSNGVAEDYSPSCIGIAWRLSWEIQWICKTENGFWEEMGQLSGYSGEGWGSASGSFERTGLAIWGSIMETAWIKDHAYPHPSPRPRSIHSNWGEQWLNLNEITNDIECLLYMYEKMTPNSWVVRLCTLHSSMRVHISEIKQNNSALTSHLPTKGGWSALGPNQNFTDLAWSCYYKNSNELLLCATAQCTNLVD